MFHFNARADWTRFFYDLPVKTPLVIHDERVY